MISDLSSYSLKDFVPFSQEVLISLFERYNQLLWPVQIFIFLFFLISLLKKLHHTKIFLTPLSLSWAMMGYFFHWKFLEKILWAGSWLGWIFFLQAVILISIVILNGLKRKKRRLSVFSRSGEILLWISLLLPLSYLLPVSEGQILLFGWGPTATALGTLGYLIHSFKLRYLLIGAIIPLAWLSLTGILVFHFNGI